MAPIRCPVTRLTLEGGTHRLSRNVGDYQATLSNISEERRHRQKPEIICLGSGGSRQKPGTTRGSAWSIALLLPHPRTPPEGVWKQIKNSTTSISPVAITTHSLAVLCTTVPLYTADSALSFLIARPNSDPTHSSSSNSSISISLRLFARLRSAWHSYTYFSYWIPTIGVPRMGGIWGVYPPPEIPKALQNRAKLNPIVKTVKIAEFRTPTPQDVRKKGSKILKLPRFAIVLR